MYQSFCAPPTLEDQGDKYTCMYTVYINEGLWKSLIFLSNSRSWESITYYNKHYHLGQHHSTVGMWYTNCMTYTTHYY